MAREKEEIEAELVMILGISREEAETYVAAISGARIDRSTLRNAGARDVVMALVAKGMLIKAARGGEFIPVHPRLALSNLFRIYDERAARERKERRLGVDRLTLELLPMYEKAKNTNAPSEEEGNNE